MKVDTRIAEGMKLLGNLFKRDNSNLKEKAAVSQKGKC